jgi:Ca2+-binding RTX toxin-like protein
MAGRLHRGGPWGMVFLPALGLLAAALPAGAKPTCAGVTLTLPVGTLTGTAANDVMLGTSAGEAIYGLGGADIICGGGGGDDIYGGPGNDTLIGGDGDDRLYGQGGCDHLKGGVGNDLLLPGPPGTACAGSLEGEGGRDRFVITSVGRNDVFGGPGKDTLDFRQSPAAMTVDLGGHPPTYDFAGAPPTSSVIYDVEVVFGSQLGDTIDGGDLDDDLRGFGGDDYLYGWDGDDRLIGGDGDDTVDGGAGNDICEGEYLQLCND